MRRLKADHTIDGAKITNDGLEQINPPQSSTSEANTSHDTQSSSVVVLAPELLHSSDFAEIDDTYPYPTEWDPETNSDSFTAPFSFGLRQFDAFNLSDHRGDEPMLFFDWEAL